MCCNGIFASQCNYDAHAAPEKPVDSSGQDTSSGTGSAVSSCMLHATSWPRVKASFDDERLSAERTSTRCSPCRSESERVGA
eukprot:4241133-Pleurochrysis_carterae.AAC.1